MKKENVWKYLARVADFRLIGVIALAFLLGISVAAQVPTGSIVGTVKDIQGLTVEGANITLTNQGTNYTYISTTSSTGAYQFEHIDFGIYRISVSKDGFKKAVVENIKLDASTQYSVPPITLEVGETNVSIIVEGGAERVQSTSAEVTGTVEKKQIEDLPILDRNPLALVELQAGVVNSGPGPGAAEPTTINGQRTSFTNITLDGINIQDNFIRQNAVDFLPNLPFNSQAEEFTIINQNAEPENGGGSSQVSLVTPHGTNDWHGQGFWYYRSNAWAANDWFNDASGLPKPTLLQNQGGGNMGGPIRKDKLFVYGYYELLRLRQQSPNDTTILSPAIRTALSAATPTLPFTYVPVGGTTPVTIPDLLSLKNSREGNSFPVLTLDPSMISLLQKVPTTSNNTRVGDGVNLLGFQFNERSNRTRDNYGFRADYNLNSRNTFTGTWSWNRDIVDRPDIDTSFNKVPLVQNNDAIKFLSTAWRWSPNANWTNEVRFGFDLAPAFFSTSQNFSAGFILNDASLPFTDPNPNFLPQGRNTHTWSYQDNAAWTHGNHTIKFGAQIQRVTIFETNSAGIFPSYALGFSNANPNFLSRSKDFAQPISRTDAANANALLSSLAGILSSVSQTFNVTSQSSGFVPNAPDSRNFRQNDWSFYGGDLWKVRRNLTLTYGIRYEYFSPVDEGNGLILLPVIPGGQTAAQTLLTNATVDFAGGPSKRGLYHGDLNNFAPNIGIAWDPRGDGKLAVRAGFSFNYVNDSFFVAAQNAATGNAGLSSSVLLTPLSGPTVSSPAKATAPPFKVPVDFQTNFNNLGNAANVGYAIDPNLRTPYVEQWNLSVQKDLGWNTTLTVGYVGNHAVGLFRAIDVNQVILGTNGFLADFNRARADGFLAASRAANDPRCTGPGTQNQCGFFNPAYQGPGSQQLTVFPNICGTGALGAIGPTDFSGLDFINNDVLTGVAGDLADIYNINQCDPPGTNNFFAPNNLLRGGDLLKNTSFSTYHAGVVEVRRRFSRGLYFQGNYVFSKVLTDYGADTNGDQTRFQPYSDNARPGYERGRAPFDLTHAFKANFTYELPFGKGHRFTPSGAFLNRVVSGWNAASIFTWQTGLPFSIVSREPTVNRAGTRSLRNTAVGTLTPGQIDSNIGVFPQANGTVFLINPKLLNPDGTAAASDGLTCAPTVTGGFCNPQPGQLGNLGQDAFTGPHYFDWDLAIGKETPITERVKLTFRAESFNVLNHPTFAPNIDGNGIAEFDINNTTFGQSTSTVSAPRILQLSLKLTF